MIKTGAIGKAEIFIRKELVYFLAIILIFLFHTAHLNVVAEDAYITFRFARHLADGHGIVWNVGEGPVEGYTNFLWLLFSALILKVGLDVGLVTQFLGIVAGLVTLDYTYRFGWKLFDLPPTQALIPCLFLALSGPFVTWAASGMETNLFGMFLLMGCYYFVRWTSCDSRRDLILCFFILFLATLTRPEGVMVFGLLALIGGLLALSRSKAEVVGYGLALLVYLIPFLGYFLWRYNYFGFLLPNTYYAKTGGTFLQYLRGGKYSGLFMFHFILPLATSPIALLWEQGFPGLNLLTRGKSLFYHFRKYVGVYLCALLSLVYTLYIIYVGGDYMAMYRFFVPVLPLIYLIFGLATSRLLEAIQGSTHKQLLAIGLVSFSAALTVLQSTPIEVRLFNQPEFMHGTYRGVQLERFAVTRFTLLGNFFKQYKQNKQDSLALEPIGVIPYYSEMKTHSIHGIVDPYIAHEQIEGRELGEGLPGHEKKDMLYVLSKKPTYIMFSHKLTPEPSSYPEYTPQADQITRENYQIKSVWLEDPVNDEAGYFSFLESKRH